MFLVSEQWDKLLQDVSIIKHTLNNISNKLDNMAKEQLVAKDKGPPILTKSFCTWNEFKTFDDSLEENNEAKAKLVYTYMHAYVTQACN